MSDERLRQLERAAASGDIDAERRLMCFKISKLELELPIDPEVLRCVELSGRYDGQEVVEKQGVLHPCLKWKRGDQTGYYNLLSGELIKVMSLHTVGGRQVGRTARHDHAVDAIRYAVHQLVDVRTGNEPRIERQRLVAEIEQQITTIARTIGIDVEVVETESGEGA